jgi:hypothetical protein
MIICLMRTKTLLWGPPIDAEDRAGGSKVAIVCVCANGRHVVSFLSSQSGRGGGRYQSGGGGGKGSSCAVVPDTVVLVQAWGWGRSQVVVNLTLDCEGFDRKRKPAHRLEPPPTRTVWGRSVGVH